MAVVIDGVKSFEGCVVNEYEENYINDSYWYAVVWNGSEFEEILYRTTAAAGAGCATVDASEELMKKYSRHLRAKMLRQRRDDLIKIARQYRLPVYTILNPLLSVYGSNSKAMKACAQLLGTKTFRSAFRANLRKQLDSWLEGKGHYEEPFSPRQIQSLMTAIH